MTNPIRHGFRFFIFYLSFVFFLSSCGGSDALDQVLETGILRVGMDASFPPFEFVDGEGNLIGFDIDLANELAARLGVEAQFVANLPYDGLYAALTADRVDIVISALYVEPAQMDDFTYSPAYFNAGQVLVTAGEELNIAGMEGLEGRVLAVEFGSEGDVVARTWERRLLDLTILSCQSADEALVKVAAGEAEVALVDYLSALAGINTQGGLRIMGQPVTDEPYAIAARREDQRLSRFVEETLAEMEADGTLARLRQRWFGSLQ